MREKIETMYMTRRHLYRKSASGNFTFSNKTLYYEGFWRAFHPENFLLTRLIMAEQSCRKVSIIGPFLSLAEEFRLIAKNKRFDIFYSGENYYYGSNRANTIIGFNPNTSDLNFRLPLWKMRLDWSNYSDHQATHKSLETIKLDRLTRSINDIHGELNADLFFSSQRRPVVIARHLFGYRRRLVKLCQQSVGLVPVGQAFQSPDRRQKDRILKGNIFNLCPENSIGAGYITEKIPEAVSAGCIPITYCRPEDLALDFDPRAVVNLYGLSDSQIIETLTELNTNWELCNRIRSIPLLSRQPSFSDLVTTCRLVLPS